MRIERVKNTKRNIVFGFINKIVLIVLPFLMRTIILYRLGEQYLGLNSLFSSILQVLNLSELGFSSAIVYSLYKPIAENDTDRICALMGYFRKTYRRIGLFIGGVGLLLLPFLPSLIKGDCPDAVNVYVLYLIYLGNTMISYLFFAYKSALLTAHQRVDVISNIGTITQGGMVLLQSMILLVTGNYYLYILMMPLFTIVNNLLVSYQVKRLYPDYAGRGELAQEDIQSIRKQVYGLMINKVCVVTRNSFDSIVISATLGLTATAIYSNYYYIMTSILGIMTVICDGMLGGIGNSLVMESREKNYQDLKKINFPYMWLGGWCTICLACLYQPFMQLWAGPKMMFDNGTVLLFCLYFYVLKMGDVRGLYSDAAGLWWNNRIRALCESICNLGLNLILVHVWGVAGVIFATLISLLVINFGFGSQIVFKHYFKNGKLGEYFLLHGKYAAVTGMVGCVTYGVCSLVPGCGILALMGKGIVCCIVPNLLYIALYHRSQEFKTAIPWVLGVLKKRG